MATKALIVPAYHEGPIRAAAVWLAIAGYNFLNGFAVTIDYPGERLRLA